MIRRLSMAAVVVLASGCFDAARDAEDGAFGPGGDGYHDDDPPVGSDSFQDDFPPIGCQYPDCPDDEPSVPIGSSCANSHECVEGAVCGASFEDGEAGPLLCRAECIEPDDASAWCSDDSACCSGACGPRGMCEASEEGGSTG